MNQTVTAPANRPSVLHAASAGGAILVSIGDLMRNDYAATTIKMGQVLREHIFPAMDIGVPAALTVVALAGLFLSWVYEPQSRVDAFARGFSVFAMLTVATPYDVVTPQTPVSGSPSSPEARPPRATSGPIAAVQDQDPPVATVDLFLRYDNSPLPPSTVVTLRDPTTARILSRDTPAAGMIRISRTPGDYVLEIEAPGHRRARVHLQLATGPAQAFLVELNESILPLGIQRLLPAAITSLRPTTYAEQVRYGEPTLTAPRQVKAILEIDWTMDSASGRDQPPLEVETRIGTIGLREVLRDVGIDLEVRWDEELPRAVMGLDGGFTVAELKKALEGFRNAEVDEDTWHFYAVVGGLYVEQGLGPRPHVLSMMFDEEKRRGFAIFDAALAGSPRSLMSLVLHEMGHSMNLPHPGSTYGDTRSVMSDPSRWGGDLADPALYTFDAFGRAHIGMAPEHYVRPDGSSYMDYGNPLPWTALARSWP